jgi:ParB-like chromosome segregation protein Spo0J
MIADGIVKFHDDLEPLLVDIHSVTQHPDNYNNGDVEAIAESIEVNGVYRPIFVQKSTGYIIAGNHTWEACQTLGAQRIPVVSLDVDDTSALSIMLADNRTASLARPDSAALVSVLSRLDHDRGNLHGTGYEPRDLEALIHLAEIPLETDEFAQWPTITVQVSPHVRRAYMTMTREADTDRDRFELMLRLAGWDGK